MYGCDYFWGAYDKFNQMMEKINHNTKSLDLLTKKYPDEFQEIGKKIKKKQNELKKYGKIREQAKKDFFESAKHFDEPAFDIFQMWKILEEMRQLTRRFEDITKEHFDEVDEISDLFKNFLDEVLLVKETDLGIQFETEDYKVEDSEDYDECNIRPRYNDLKVKLKLQKLGWNHKYTEYNRDLLFQYGTKKFFIRYNRVSEPSAQYLRAQQLFDGENRKQ